MPRVWSNLQKLALPKFTLAPEPSWREASGKLAYRFQSDSSTLRRLGSEPMIAASRCELELTKT